MNDCQPVLEKINRRSITMYTGQQLLFHKLVCNKLKLQILHWKKKPSNYIPVHSVSRYTIRFVTISNVCPDTIYLVAFSVTTSGGRNRFNYGIDYD